MRIQKDDCDWELYEQNIRQIKEKWDNRIKVFQITFAVVAITIGIILIIGRMT